MRNPARRRLLRSSAALSAMLLAGTVAPAAGQQPYPSRPVRVVVPYPAGGGVDVMARIVAARMGDLLGQPVVIDNRPGASANLGPDHVAKSRPDGHTLLASATYLVTNPLLEEGLSWRPGDLQPVARLTTTPNLFVVGASAPFRTLPDFVAHARANPGVPVATSGSGSPQTMAVELLRARARLDFNLVPYRGAPPVMSDLLNGTVAMSVLPLGAVMGMLQAGQLRPLAAASAARSPLMPEVPSMTEAGYPELTMVSWYGLHAPAGTPDSVVRTLAEAARLATADPEVRRSAARAGGEAAFLGTAEFTAFLDEDHSRWVRTVAALRPR
jgi:tripartite-type tricarboxylate transporter receptor subunit TctC